ncbi:hypothetical protein RND81_04G141600 [Saponaria officinalis]|uniref:GBF-interacting protein 1 N-terminal domain-containing protein n=1 Tax=Saponaria officinalis TaxID=3572 RepID=A0AAW1LEQ6_SAPOF
MVIVSASLRKTIESIKEIVGNHSDTDVYNALKESNMSLDEAVDKLLHQDTFHEVRKRRDKKKESSDYSGQVETRIHNDHTSQGPKFHSNFNGRSRRGGYTRRDAGISREFRVVRDNRVNQRSTRETESSTQVTLSSTSQRNVPERSAHAASNNHRLSGGRHVQNLNSGSDFRPKEAQESNCNTIKEHRDENTTEPGSQVSVTKQNETHSQSGSPASSTVGVYASASDPVHVPSPDSRSPAVGAIRREIGVVGGRRQSSESGPKQSHQQRVSNLNSVLGTSTTTQSSRHIATVSRSDQNHGTAVESVMINSAGSRFGNHFGNRFHQQPAGQKGAFSSKEWKPKTNKKPNVSSPGVIGSPVKSASIQTEASKNLETETDELQDKLQQINIHDTQKVIIAHNIRVPEFDRCRLTFGSIGIEADGIENPSAAFQAADVVEVADSVEPVEASPSKNQINVFDDQARTSASGSPAGESSDNPSPVHNDSAGVPNTENYANMSLVHNSSSFTTSKSEELQESIELPNFSAYDPQPVYDMPYFRPSVDDAVRGTVMPSNQEGLSSHAVNIVPNSSVAMLQQQTPITQMYPQVHLSHFANVMPYRQFIPPMYVPPMVPGYSGNPAYPHLSNGSSYVLMPGGGSHVPANGLKYGIQQFKPFPAGSPTGFSSLVSPTGYAMNAPGVIGGPTSLDDSSRLKYKDNNLYVPNPQAETSDVWIQNQREHPGMQSSPYFNMQGQSVHPAYMQSLGAHPSFNAAAPPSSQMQFPGMYPPQPTGIPNGHHLAPSNIGVGVAQPAPGPQVGAYQQPQMNHLNWTTNF